MRISDWSSDVCSSDLYPFGEECSSPASFMRRHAHRASGAGSKCTSLCATQRYATELQHPGRKPGRCAQPTGEAEQTADRLLARAGKAQDSRQEERRVGKECVSTCR